MNPTKQKAGKAGGLATVQKHGREHMQRIGAKGAAEFHRRYMLQPFGLNDFRIVRRETGETVSFLSGRIPFKV